MKRFLPLIFLLVCALAIAGTQINSSTQINWVANSIPTNAINGSLGTGSVTSVTCGSGLSGGTFNVSGTCAINFGNANTWTNTQTFDNGYLSILGSSTGTTLLDTANAGASNYTITFPAVTDTVAVLGSAQTFTATKTWSGVGIALNGSSSGTFILEPAAAAGTVTMVAPTSVGSNGYVLSTNGGNPAVTSWINPSAGGTVTSIGCGTSLLCAASPITTAGTISINYNNAGFWTGTQTFANSDILLNGSSTGKTTFSSANTSATSYTLTFPAITDTLAALTATQTLTNKTLTNPIDTAQTLSYGAGSVTWNTANGAIATLTLTGNGATVATPTNAGIGTYVLHIIQDGTGSRAMQWASPVYQWAAGTAPTLTTTANHQDICTFIYDGTYMFGSCVLNFPVN